MKVLIVEDDPKLARFLARVLTEEGYVVDLCSNGADAVVQASSDLYSLTILDWMLPELDGLSVCRNLRRAGSLVPILMLTARGEVQERVLGLDAGADDYLVKPFEIEELLARVRALHRRSQSVQLLRIGALELDKLGRRASIGGQPAELTQKEFEFLLYLASRPERVCGKAELLSAVWELSHDPGTNLVEVLVSRLRDKLGSFSWMIETVRGVGYRLRDKQSP